MSLLEVALDCIRAGWYVFPCWPRDKKPLVSGGFKAASNDEAQIRLWWDKWPEANVAIATGASGLTVLDCDHGLADEADYVNWVGEFGLDNTYTVRTGGRDAYRVQLYYKTVGDPVKSIAWADAATETSGDIRGATGYVMAAGCVHPSGETYAVINDLGLAPVPAVVRQIQPASREGGPGHELGAWFDPGGVITAGRHEAMLRLLGKKRGEGYDDSEIELYALEINAERFSPPIEDLDRILANVFAYPVGDPGPDVVLGGKVVAGPSVPPPVPSAPASSDWRSHYHTFEQMDSAPDPVFLIDDFLQYESITAIAAPVGQRKSLIALNVAHALCTRAALFDRFEANPDAVPSRVLYLCPEMGIRSFANRVRKIGLMPYVGKTLFCRTMSPVNPDNELQEELTLDELTPEEVAGAVIIIDTAVRFIKGDENSSEHMRVFAASVFRMTKLKAAAVLVLFHSSKGTKEASELTLENAMRGSGELGAFVTCCWATRLQDPEHPYESKSYLSNVKPRDFDAKPFEVEGGDVVDCKLHFVGDGTAPAVLIKGQAGNKSDPRAEDAARTIIAANPDATLKELQKILAEAGIQRSLGWISARRAEVRGTGVKRPS